MVPRKVITGLDDVARDCFGRVPVIPRSAICASVAALDDYAPGAADRGDALAASGGSANAIAFPSGSGTFTWRTPFE
jgi:hypothetical protein